MENGKMVDISVVGLGKLGSPLLAVLAKSGLHVCGIDVNAHVVETLNAGLAPIQEPKLQSLLTEYRGRFRATTDWNDAIGNSQITYLIVPTPSGADGAFKNDYLLSALTEVGRVLRMKPEYHLVVINSTVMPGSTGGVLLRCLEEASGRRVGHDLGLCYNPEFIALGNVVEGLLKPDFVLIGESDDRAGTILEGVYRKVVGTDVPVRRMNFVNAELTKIAVNTFVTTKISFANMLGEICDKLAGADVDVVTTALGSDTRIGSKYLRSGTAYGGPCFPRDTVAFGTLATSVGVHADLAIATDTVNRRQLARVFQILTDYTSVGDRVAVLGLAYKPDTSVIEQSQGVMLASAIHKSGRHVVVHDPLAAESARAVLGSNVEFADSAVDAAGSCDAVVVVVPNPEYEAVIAELRGTERTSLVIDCWRLCNGSHPGTGPRLIQLGRNSTFEPSIEYPAISAAE